MKNNKVYKILENAYNKDIAENIISSYTEIESNFVLEKWKPSELDSGHFVEAARRIIEYELFGGSYTQFGKRLNNFNDSELQRYERQTSHHDSFRKFIPRALKAIYNIRNSRGVAHIGEVSPNEMDATYILYSCKWVLSEIVRLKTNLPIEETKKLIEEIVERRVEILWKEADFTRILNTRMYAKEKVLVLLFDKSPRKVGELQGIIEYKNDSDFADIIQNHHKNRLLEHRSNGDCYISPTGIIEAENILKKYNHS